MSGLAYRRDEQRLQRMSMELTASKRAQADQLIIRARLDREVGRTLELVDKAPNDELAWALDCGGAAV